MLSIALMQNTKSQRILFTTQNKFHLCKHLIHSKYNELLLQYKQCKQKERERT